MARNPLVSKLKKKLQSAQILEVTICKAMVTFLSKLNKCEPFLTILISNESNFLCVLRMIGMPTCVLGHFCTLAELLHVFISATSCSGIWQWKPNGSVKCCWIGNYFKFSGFKQKSFIVTHVSGGLWESSWSRLGLAGLLAFTLQGLAPRFLSLSLWGSVGAVRFLPPVSHLPSWLVITKASCS